MLYLQTISQEDSTLGGSPTGRPYGHTLQHKASDLRLPLPTPGSSSGRCYHNSMGQMESSLHLPPICPTRPPTPSHSSFQGNVGAHSKPTSFNLEESTTRVMGVGQPSALLPPFSKAANEVHLAPWSPSAPWTALLFSAKPSPPYSDQK